MILFCDLSPLTISFITSNVVVACSLSDWCENKTIRSELDKFDLGQNKCDIKKMEGVTDYHSRYYRILKKIHTSRYQVGQSRLQFLYSPHLEAELSLLVDLADGTERIFEVLIVGGDPSGTSCIKNEFAKICWLSN